jgi:hypothetical protein
MSTLWANVSVPLRVPHIDVDVKDQVAHFCTVSGGDLRSDLSREIALAAVQLSTAGGDLLLQLGRNGSL